MKNKLTFVMPVHAAKIKYFNLFCETYHSIQPDIDLNIIISENEIDLLHLYTKYVDEENIIKCIDTSNESKLSI